MFRLLPYIALFATAALSQIFIFDNLAMSVYVAPLVYILFIVMLPTETKQLVMLAMGVLTGVVMDSVMGTGGLNSIATIFVAFFRAHIIRLIVGRERGVVRGVPSGAFFGEGDFLWYIAIVISLHHLIFFLFESLSLSSVMLVYVALRFVFSTAMSIIYVWLLSRFFSINNFLK